MQTLFLFLTVFFAVNTFLLVGVKAYSQLVYGRSAMATISELYLKTQPDKKALKDERRILEYLAERRVENAKEFHTPKLKLTSKLSRTKFLSCDVYSFVNSTSPKATLIYIHGGGFIRRPSRYHFSICDKLSKTLNFKVVMPLYPLSPEFNHKQAFYYLKKLYNLYNGQRIFIAGDSAGGGLALSFCEYLLENHLTLPEKLILFSPWVDLSMDNKDVVKFDKFDPTLSVTGLKVIGKVWAGDTFIKDYAVSPLYGKIKGLCPVFLSVGERELFYPDIIKLKNRLINEDVPFYFTIGKGLNHGYPLFPIPEAKKSLMQVKEFVEG